MSSELLRHIAIWIAFALVGVVCLLISAFVELAGLGLAAHLFTESLGGTMGLILLVAIAIATFVGALAVHEVGHLVMGWLVGMTPLMAQLGPMILHPVAGRWRLRWDSREPLIAARAFCTFHRIGRKRVILYALGGCLANLILFLAAAPFVLVVPGPARPIVLLLAAHSLVAALANPSPIHSFGLDTDGMMVVKLLVRQPWTIANFQSNWQSAWQTRVGPAESM